MDRFLGSRRSRRMLIIATIFGLGVVVSGGTARAGDLWVEEGKLTPAEGAVDNYGAAVAVSGDTALVGAQAVDNGRGAAYVFTRSNGVWTEQAKLTADDGVELDSFGYSVALEGDTALVGARWADIDGNEDQGAVYVFTRSEGAWNQQAKLTATDGAVDDQFGNAVALSGNTALVGAFVADIDGLFNPGAAYVFTGSGGSWNEQAKLTAADGAEIDQFGAAVALDGDTAVVGAHFADIDDNTNQGAVYVFTRDGELWNEQGKLTGSDGAGFDSFGGAVAVAGDTALIGAHQADVDGAFNQGAAYVFTRSDGLWSEQGKLVAADGAASDAFGSAVAVAGDIALVGAEAADVEESSSQGAVYAFDRTGDVWSERDKLTVADGAAFAGLGAAIALSGDTAVFGAPGGGFPPIPGDAYVFFDLDLPPDVGVIEGTVRGLGYCGAEPAVLEGATVEILGAESTETVETGSGGFYRAFLSESESPLTITVTMPGHLSAAVEGIVFSGGDTVVQDFDLVLDAPCATVDPQELTVELPAGSSETLSLDLSNADGGGSLDWSLATAVPPSASRPTVLSVGDAADCDNDPGLIVHDDGEVDDAYTSGNPEIEEVIFVDRFTPDSYPAFFRALCVAFATTGPTSLDFEIVVFDDDGGSPGGQPGTELGALPVTAADIPAWPISEPTWYSYDLSSLDISIESGSVYLGVRWQPVAPAEPDVVLAADEGVGSLGGGWWWNTLDGWVPMGVPGSFQEYRALYVRAVENLGGCHDPAELSWLNPAQEAGVVAPGGTSTLDVTVDAAGLDVGDHRASLCIATNDTRAPLLVVPVTVTVTAGGDPELAFQPTSLDFGDVPIGTTSPPQSATLHNVGGGDAPDLTFNDISASGFDVDAGACGTSLPAGGSCQVVITFTPPVEGPIQPTFVASTPGFPPALLQLSGNGVIPSPPSIDVDPETLAATLMQGAMESQTLTLANLGDEELEWLVPDLSQFGANVNALTVWDDGSGPALYVGGNDNTEFKGVARWDGAEWSLLGAGMNDDVEALTVFDGALIVGGRFTEADGVTVNRVARWDGSQWSALGDGVDSTVYALAVYDGELIAGGLFTEAGGQPANRVARWDGTSWSPLGTGADNRVTELIVYDGALHAAGWFTEAGGVPASRIARWDGTQWSALGAGADSLVHAVTVYDGKLIAGGRFEEAGGIPAIRVASWDGSTWAALGSGIPGGVTTQVDMLAVFDGALIAGGRFLEAGGVDAMNIARWDGSAWSALGPGLSGHVAAGTVFDGALIAGGQFNFAGELPTRGIARWDGAAWSALVTEPSDCDVPSWLQVDPTEGTVAGDDAQPVSVAFDAADLPLGSHQANLCLLTNDPAALLVMVPVELTVLAAPEADITPEAFTFTLPQGDGADDVLDVGNVGAADLEWSIGAVASDLVVFDDIDFTVPATQFGGSVRWDTGETCEGCQSKPFDFNMWRTNSDGNLAFFWPGQSEAGGGGVSHDGSRYAVLGAGDTVGPHSVFILFTPTDTTLDWRQATDVDGQLGFRFVNPDTQQVNYGYARITTTGVNGHPATVKSWVYDQGGNPIAVGGCTDPAEIPWLTIAPLTGTTPPAGSVPVDVSVDTTGLAPGVHEEQFCVTTNDPGTPLVAIPVAVTVLGDQPVIDVSPLALELAAPQGGSDDGVLSIGNLGTANLDWSLDEAMAGSGVAGDVVADGSFEAGTPNPSWEEGSTNFGTPLCDATCGNINGARNGDWWAWFGGIGNAAETGFVTQEVTLPAAPAAELRFWLLIPDANTPGHFEVMLDDQVLFSVTEADAADYSSYTEVIVDVSTFADGEAHLLGFEGETEAGGITSFFLDDVSLVIASNCVSPTDIPWLSATPTTGTTPPAGSAQVDVTADATGLEPGTHTAQLCLTSNDPQTSLVEIPITLNVSRAAESFTPVDLTVDPPELTPEANGLFEPGETVDVAPAWRNDGELATSLGGTASNFTGPEGATYSIDLDAADYGLIQPDATTSCLDTEVCYRLGLDDPAARPATHWDAAFDETLDDADETTKTWTLHVGESFDDVPTTSIFYPAIETLLHSGVTGGCDDGEYCPAGVNTRSQMPVFVLRALMGIDYTPPTCDEGDERLFEDVPAANLFCPWIEDLANRDVVSGCGNGNYCPTDAVTRAQMAIFLLKTLEGADYTPIECTARFDDVPCTSLFADWIEDLAAREITGGCSETEYCPADPVTRGQMAVFVTRTFGLTLYGP